MKRRFRNFMYLMKREYEEYCFTMYYNGSMNGKRSYRTSWIGFVWYVFTGYVYWWVVTLIAPSICQVLGHNMTMECGGDAESGPITTSWCKRCGGEQQTQFGM